jgi:peptidoglycan/LPS O-acetylase OafA/YrhL
MRIDVNHSDREPALDGLRAIAVLGVLIQHCMVGDLSVLRPGPAGVRLFFVLSGFLITGILIRAREQAEAAGWSRSGVWRAFVERRALRIFPLAYLGMGVAWLAGAPALVDRGWSYVLYVANIDLAVRGFDAHFGFAHFWSLAIEEQFYLVWPLLILFTPRRWWRAIVVLLLVAAPVMRVLTWHSSGAWAAYVLPWCRMDALAFGALLSMWRARIFQLGQITAALAIALLIVGTYVSDEAVLVTMLESFFVVVSGVVVVSVARGYGAALLRTRPLVYLGSISYGIYLWGGLMPFLVHAAQRAAGVSVLPPDALGLRHFAVITMLSVGLSAMSWHLFERPINDLKRFVPYVGGSSLLHALGRRLQAQAARTVDTAPGPGHDPEQATLAR